MDDFSCSFQKDEASEQKQSVDFFGGDFDWGMEFAEISSVPSLTLRRCPALLQRN